MLYIIFVLSIVTHTHRHSSIELILSVPDVQIRELRLIENISLIRPLHTVVKP